MNAPTVNVANVHVSRVDKAKLSAGARKRNHPVNTDKTTAIMPG
jgi:hypothetical protein